MKNLGWSAVAFTAASLLAAPFAPFSASPALAQDACISDAARAEVADCHNGATTAAATQSPSTQRRQVAVRQVAPPSAPAARRRPGLTLDEGQVAIEQGRQARALAILRQEIQAVKLLVQTTRTTDPSRPEVIGRLAETYTEYQAALRNASGNLDEQIFCACPESADASCATDHPQWPPASDAQCTAKQQEKTTLEAELARAYTDANATLAMLIRDHPQYPQLDRIMFSLAYGLERVGQTERAQQVYLALAERFPQSRYVPHAYLAFGEYFFNNNLMEDAQAAYQRVIDIGVENNAVYGYAVFKLAWVYYNQNDYENSLTQFEHALQYALDNPSSLAAGQIVTECRRNIVMPYAMVRTPNRALRDFMVYARNDRTLALGMYEELALYFYDNGQWQEAIDGFKLLIQQLPDSVKVCTWQSHVVDATMRGRNNKQETVAAMDQLGEVYRRFTADTNQPEAARNECKANTAAIMFILATQWHVEAVGGTQGSGTGTDATGPERQIEGSGNRDTMRAAADMYQLLLNNFPDLDELDFSTTHINPEDYPNRYRIAYFLADLYYQAEDWVHCGPAFELVTQINPTGEFTNDAAGAAVRCYIRVYETEYEGREGSVGAATPTATPTTPVAAPARGRGRGRGRQNQAAAPPAPPPENTTGNFARRDYTQLENGMLRAFANFMCVANSESDDLVTIKYRRARVYYESNHYEEAAILFRDIAMNHKGASQDEFAANLYFDCLNTLATRQEPVRPSCMSSLETDSRPLCQLYCSTDADRSHYGDLCRVCANLECEIKRQRAESLHTAHRYVDAGNAYLDIIELNQNRPESQQCGEMDVLLNNAASDYQAGYQVGQAISVRNALIDTYPNSPLVPEAMFLIGASYHAIAWYDQAADWYERFARAYPTKDQSSCTAEQVSAGTCPIASNALMNATLFRLGLGNIDKAQEDADLFARNYGRSMAYQTAKVMYAIGSYYEHRADWGQTVIYYTRYMHDYGRTAPAHLLLQAQVLIARAYRLEGRNDRARETLRAYQNGVHLWETGRIAERVAALEGLSAGEKATIYRDSVNAAAEAYFYLAEEEFKAVQAITLERYAGGANDQRITEWIQRQLMPWAQRRKAAVDRAILAYNKVRDVKITMTTDAGSADIISPPWQIAAAARVGQMYREVVDVLRNVPIPQVVEDNPDLYEIFSNALETQAAPLNDSARSAFQFCLTSSTGARWFNEWSRQCEAELAHMDPAQYPAAVELRGAGGMQFAPPAWPGSVTLGTADAPSQNLTGGGSTESTAPATTTAPTTTGSH